MSAFTALLSRDLALVLRRPGDVTVVLAFFVVAVTLFPLGIGPETNLLQRVAAIKIHQLLGKRRKLVHQLSTGIIKTVGRIAPALPARRAGVRRHAFGNPLQRASHSVLGHGKPPRTIPRRDECGVDVLQQRLGGGGGLLDHGGDCQFLRAFSSIQAFNRKN